MRLICHAATRSTRLAAFPTDEPLDDRVHARLAAASWPLDGADRSWTSPALRAAQTATALGITARADPVLRDCDYGRWTGCTLDELQAAEPEAVGLWLRDPAAAPHGGESLLQVIGRTGAWLDSQIGVPGTVLAVTHASVIRAAIVHILDAGPSAFWRIDIAPLCLVKLVGQHGRWTLGSIAPLVSRTARKTLP